MREQLQIIREMAQNILDELACVEARIDEAQREMREKCDEMKQYTDRFIGH